MCSSSWLISVVTGRARRMANELTEIECERKLLGEQLEEAPFGKNCSPWGNGFTVAVWARGGGASVG